jgi:hypothetical protein
MEILDREAATPAVDSRSASPADRLLGVATKLFAACALGC